MSPGCRRGWLRGVRVYLVDKAAPDGHTELREYVGTDSVSGEAAEQAGCGARSPARLSKKGGQFLCLPFCWLAREAARICARRPRRAPRRKKLRRRPFALAKYKGGSLRRRTAPDATPPQRRLAARGGTLVERLWRRTPRTPPPAGWLGTN